jgi:hypothetical protein
MKRIALPLLLVTLGLAPASALASEATPEVPLLRFDPFASSPLSPAAPDAQSPNPTGWAPILRAVLVAGDKSMVNLGGVILGLEQEEGGYRLVEVREGEAVFLKAGARVVLTLQEP